MKKNILCTICSSSKVFLITNLIREGQYNIFQCKNCNTAFINDYKDIDYSSDYKTLMFEKGSTNKKKTEQRNFSLKNTHFQLSQIIKDNKIKNILEIGPGMGLSSNFIKKQFPKLNISALEIDIRNNSFLKKIGFQNIFRDFSEIESNSFDLIFCVHLIEHISDPYSFLNQIKNKAKKNAIIFFITPNHNNIYFKTLPKNNLKKFMSFFYHIAHPYYYDHKSMKYLLAKLFKIIKIFTVQEYSLKNYMKWYIEGKPSLNIYDGTVVDKELIDIDKYFKKKTDSKNLGSDLFVIFKNK